MVRFTALLTAMFLVASAFLGSIQGAQSGHPDAGD